MKSWPLGDPILLTVVKGNMGTEGTSTHRVSNWKVPRHFLFIKWGPLIMIFIKEQLSFLRKSPTYSWYVPAKVVKATTKLLFGDCTKPKPIGWVIQLLTDWKGKGYACARVFGQLDQEGACTSSLEMGRNRGRGQFCLEDQTLQVSAPVWAAHGRGLTLVHALSQSPPVLIIWVMFIPSQDSGKHWGIIWLIK